jgi:hypothetical protein
VYVSLKDSILQRSTPLRHAAETLEAIRLAGHEDCKVLVVKTDGGPDRNNTFVSVQLAFFALAIELDLTCLILMRTTPGQSYVNPVERVMSVLNLALHGVSLERGHSGADTEALLKNLNTIKARLLALEPNGCDVRSAHRERFVTDMQVSCTSCKRGCSCLMQNTLFLKRTRVTGTSVSSVLGAEGNDMARPCSQCLRCCNNGRAGSLVAALDQHLPRVQLRETFNYAAT